MLFCCLWCNVETSCHKHFVVVSRHQRTPPLTTSGVTTCGTVSGGAMFITRGRSQRWQHAVKPGSESRLLPIPPAFDAPVRGGGFPSDYYHAVWCGKAIMVWLPDGKKKFWRYDYSFLTECTNVTETRRDGRTDTAWRLRQRLHSIARQKWKTMQAKVIVKPIAECSVCYCLFVVRMTL